MRKARAGWPINDWDWGFHSFSRQESLLENIHVPYRVEAIL